jgi:hypothetical protein
LSNRKFGSSQYVEVVELSLDNGLWLSLRFSGSDGHRGNDSRKSSHVMSGDNVPLDTQGDGLGVGLGHWHVMGVSHGSRDSLDLLSTVVGGRLFGRDQSYGTFWELVLRIYFLLWFFG